MKLASLHVHTYTTIDRADKQTPTNTFDVLVVLLGGMLHDLGPAVNDMQLVTLQMQLFVRLTSANGFLQKRRHRRTSESRAPLQQGAQGIANEPTVAQV